MTVRLILLTGSHAGLEAPLQRGYYMIGRHAECQIRPKSRSVSRHHCLIHHHDDSVKLMDLGSTSGTRINEKKLEPKTWFSLSESDVLRLGKVQFRVGLSSSVNDSGEIPDLPDSSPVVRKPAPPAAETKPRGVVKTPSIEKAASSPPPPIGAKPKRPKMVTGEAWETFDVAAFLETEDNQDREDRYDQIRAKNAAAEKAEQDADDSGEIDPFSDDDSSVFDETRGDAESATSLGTPTAGPANSSKSSEAAKKTHRKSSPSPRRNWNLLSRFRPSGDTDQLKLVAVFVVTLAVIGFLGWKVFQFSTGPEVRVIEQID